MSAAWSCFKFWTFRLITPLHSGGLDVTTSPGSVSQGSPSQHAERFILSWKYFATNYKTDSATYNAAYHCFIATWIFIIGFRLQMFETQDFVRVSRDTKPIELHWLTILTIKNTTFEMLWCNNNLDQYLPSTLTWLIWWQKKYVKNCSMNDIDFQYGIIKSIPEPSMIWFSSRPRCSWPGTGWI